MNPIKAALFGVFLPGLISLVVFGAAWFRCRRRVDTQHRTWAGAVALGVSFCTAYFLLLGIPAFPPTEAAKWIPLIVIATAIFGLVDAVFKLPYALVWFVRIVVSLSFTWQLLNPMVRYHWTAAESSRWVGWLAVGIVAIWGFLDETAWRVRGAGLPIALALAAGALSLGLLWGSSALLFQIGLILAAATAGAILPGFWRPALSLASGAIPVYIMVYYSLLMSGYFYAELPLYSAAAFALAPLGPTCAMISGVDKSRLGQNAIAIAGALIPAMVGLYFASGPAFMPDVYK